MDDAGTFERFPDGPVEESFHGRQFGKKDEGDETTDDPAYRREHAAGRVDLDKGDDERRKSGGQTDITRENEVADDAAADGVVNDEFGFFGGEANSEKSGVALEARRVVAKSSHHKGGRSDTDDDERDRDDDE